MVAKKLSYHFWIFELFLKKNFLSGLLAAGAGQTRQKWSLARMDRWQALIDSGTYRNTVELAMAIGKDPAFVARMIRLTLLAPEIVHAILAGRPSGNPSHRELCGRSCRFAGKIRRGSSASNDVKHWRSGMIPSAFLRFRGAVAAIGGKNGF